MERVRRDLLAQKLLSAMPQRRRVYVWWVAHQADVEYWEALAVFQGLEQEGKIRKMGDAQEPWDLWTEVQKTE